MVSSSKILTVSYGTFSCTLEGFDDSFDTMKAIAEYFRDLAQEDRYFGAEPPTPDTEMLARIAEREIERRVEARFEKGNLVLRPTEETETPQGDVAPEPSSGAALAGAAVGAAVAGVAASVQQDDSAEEEEDLADDITLNLAELDLEQGDDAAEEEVVVEGTEDVLEAADEYVAEEDEAPADDILEVAEPEVEAQADEPATLADIDVPEDDAVDAEDTAEDVIEEVAELVAEPVEDDVPATTDTVADKLQRIRAVVASKSQEEPEYIEDEHAMSGAVGDGNDENDALDGEIDMPSISDVSALTADLDEDTSEFDEDAENLFADTVAAIVNDQIDAEVEDEPEVKAELAADYDAEAIIDEEPEEDADFAEDLTSEAEADEEVVSDDADDDDMSDTEAELVALRAKIAELEAQTSAPVVEDAIEDVAAKEDLPEETEEASSEEEPEEVAEPIVARVSKAKRAEVEAALAAGELEEVDAEDEEEPVAEAHPVPGADDSTLTPEQEQELARELAELQEEIDSDEDWDFDVAEEEAEEAVEAAEEIAEDVSDEVDDTLDAIEEEAEANIRKAVRLSSPARAMLTDTSIEEDDTSVDRLIDQTESAMDEPEGNRRRSAIAHLRAAVAATKADRLLGLGKKKADKEEPYREDLADAVRPRRPKVSETKSERPAPVRPAPLQLVAEQRIDSDDEAVADVEPVRPRRVTRAEHISPADDIISDESGFAEYAESQGANSLPELLEAAASYMSFVEGRDQFSRPQLMTKLHQAEGSTSSREERLRSFGQLLREGKIEKKGGGRFTASDNIGFKPKARAAG